MADTGLRTFEELYNTDYKTYSKYWQICDDCFAGEEVIKSKWSEYIAIPKAKQRNNELTAAYVKRGKFPPFAADTLEQSIGILGSAVPDVVFDGKAKKLDFLRDYATPMRDGVTALFARTIANVLRYGRYCLLLEPNNNPQGGFHINEFKPQKYMRAMIADRDGESYAQLVLLDTSFIDYDPAVWRETYTPQITVLAIDNRGEYYQAKFGITAVPLLRIADDGAIVPEQSELMKAAQNDLLERLLKFNIYEPDGAIPDELIYPDKFGKRFDRIPFTCINAQDLNLVKYGDVPLLKLCRQCLHILNADCDHQNLLFMTSDPKPTIIGGDGEPKDIYLGVDGTLSLPEGFVFSFVSPAATGLDQQRANIAEMVDVARKMGVSLSGTESAAYTPGVSLELLRNAQTAALKIINANCGAGIEEQLRFAGKWSGMTDEELNRDIKFIPSDAFAEIKATAAECVSVAMNAGALKMTEKEVRQYIEKNGLADARDWEEVKEELEAEAQAQSDRELNSAKGAFGFDAEPETEPEQKEQPEEQ